MCSKFYLLVGYLCFPKASETLEYDEIVCVLLKHLKPALNSICKSVKFQKHFQLENEPIQDFAARVN